MLNKIFALSCFLIIYPSLAETDKQVKKFEDLFIWKISDELKLTTLEETSVSNIIRESNKKKAAGNTELEVLYKKLKEETTESGRKSTFAKIKTAHRAQLAVTLDELENIQKNIGLKKLGQYLELKRDLAEKIKNMWIQHEKKSGGTLPPPKVIEEK